MTNKNSSNNSQESGKKRKYVHRLNVKNPAQVVSIFKHSESN